MAQSALAFNDSISSIRSQILLTETEESWDKIACSITAFTELVRSSTSVFPQETIAAAREFHRPINSALKSERTRLSGPATDLISAIAAELGTSFDTVLPLFFPTLLQLCARTSKVVINRSRACILSIIENTQLVSVLQYFLQSIKDKSTTLRVVVAEGTLACINSSNPPDLEKEARTKEIETLIRATIRDANADVRKIGKQVFHAYEALLPSKAESFAAPLTPTSKKYLGLITRPKSAMSQTVASTRPVNNLSRSTSSSVTSAPPPPQHLKKKSSQKLGAPPTAPAPSNPSNVLAPASRPNKSSGAPSSSTAGPQSRSTSQLGIIADTQTSSAAPLRDDILQQQQLSGYVLVRPALPSSRSDSTTATGKHFRSVSALSTVTSGPVRNVKPLSKSTSSAPLRVPIASSSATDVSSAPDVVMTSRPAVGPVRVDPSAGRERVHAGPRKPELPKLSPEEPPVSVIRPPPKVNKEESGIGQSKKERPGPKKPELPKLLGASTSKKEETTRKPEVPRVPRKETQQPAPITKKISMKTMRHAADNHKTTEGMTSAGGKSGHTEAEASVPATAGSRSTPSSASEPAVEKSQVAASRTRTFSSSASTSSLTTAKPPMPRARTISTSTAATKPPVPRTRTVSTSTSSTKPSVPRTRTVSATSTDKDSTKASSKIITKPAWGGSGAGARPVASVRRPGGKEKEPVTKIVAATQGTRKQKRPSVVPEEVEGAEVAPEPESKTEAAEEKMSEEVESTDGGDSLQPEGAGDEKAQKKEIIERAGEQGSVAAASGSESKVETLTAVSPSATMTQVPGEEVVTAEQPDGEAPLIEFSAVLDTTELPVSEVTRSSAPEVLQPPPLAASVVPTHQPDLNQLDATLMTAHIHSDKDNEDATPVAKACVDPSTLIGAVHTPVRRNLHGLGLDFMPTADGDKTPITALLASIQQGFLFSPVTPLSPADSYLPKGLGGTGGTGLATTGNTSIPFPLFSNKAPEFASKGETAEDGSDTAQKPFGFVWGEPSRQALGTMKMN